MQCVGLVVGGDVGDTRLLGVGVRAAEGLHVDLLAGDTADHVGSGDEHASLGRHDHDVGQRGAVRRAAGGEAEDDGNLGDAAGRADHRLEDEADGVQGFDALREARAAGVPEPDDRALRLEGGIDRRRRCACSPRRPSRRP